jgi:hypothetical protein
MNEGVIWIVPADWELFAEYEGPDIGFVCSACGMEKCFDLVDQGDGVLTKVINCTHLLRVDGVFKPICNDCFATYPPPRSTASKLFGT